MELVLGGTSDTREYLKDKKEPYMVSVATDYGYKHFSRLFDGHVIHVRFTEATLAEFIISHHITLITDTTHPFAQEITATARVVCERLGIPYVYRKRNTTDHLRLSYPGMHTVTGWPEAARHETLKNRTLFFTIGSKNLHYFKDSLDRAVVRVLDDENAVKICLGLGIPRERIIAARGPFSTEDNLKVIKKWDIQCLITKQSGAKGGFVEKAEAAEISGADLLVINGKA